MAHHKESRDGADCRTGTAWEQAVFCVLVQLWCNFGATAMAVNESTGGEFVGVVKSRAEGDLLQGRISSVGSKLRFVYFKGYVHVQIGKCDASKDR